MRHSAPLFNSVGLLGKDADHILVHDSVRQANLLGLRIELARLAPHKGILEVRGQTTVDAVTHSLDGCALSKANGVSKIWLLAALLGVHSARSVIDELTGLT